MQISSWINSIVAVLSITLYAVFLLNLFPLKFDLLVADEWPIGVQHMMYYVCNVSAGAI